MTPTFIMNIMLALYPVKSMLTIVYVVFVSQTIIYSMCDVLTADMLTMFQQKTSYVCYFVLTETESPL